MHDQHSNCESDTQCGDQPTSHIGFRFCDGLISINGRSIDLAHEPLTIELQGFTLKVSYESHKHRCAGVSRKENYSGYDIEIVCPDKGDANTGQPPGRLFINGKHIDYEYEPTSGRIHSHSMFSIHFSLSDFAHAYVSANPNLHDTGHQHQRK
jgi:hypothetical protein